MKTRGSSPAGQDWGQQEALAAGVGLGPGTRPKQGRSLGEIPHDAQRRPSVPRPKMVPVVQVVKKLVELLASLKPRGPGDRAVVGGVEGGAEAPKHAGYRQLIL